MPRLVSKLQSILVYHDAICVTRTYDLLPRSLPALFRSLGRAAMYRSNSNYSPVDKPEEEEGLIIAQTSRFQVSEPVEPLRKAKQPRGRPWPRSFVWFIHGSLIFIQIAVLFSFWIHAPSAMSKFPVYCEFGLTSNDFGLNISGSTCQRCCGVQGRTHSIQWLS